MFGKIVLIVEVIKNGVQDVGAGSSAYSIISRLLASPHILEFLL
jgi:hypothetical protein